MNKEVQKCARRSHGRRYFTPDMSRLAHARDDDPAFAVQERVCRVDELFVQFRRNFAQAFCFGVQHFARPIEILTVSSLGVLLLASLLVRVSAGGFLRRMKSFMMKILLGLRSLLVAAM